MPHKLVLFGLLDSSWPQLHFYLGISKLLFRLAAIKTFLCPITIEVINEQIYDILYYTSIIGFLLQVFKCSCWYCNLLYYGEMLYII